MIGADHKLPSKLSNLHVGYRSVLMYCIASTSLKVREEKRIIIKS